MKGIKMTDMETKKVMAVVCEADELNARSMGLAVANASGTDVITNFGDRIEIRDTNGYLVKMLEMMEVEEDRFDGILPGDLVT